jgi:anti-sigma factor ChrR (cupin superfamily)
MLIVLVALPLQAQQHGHLVAMPDTLKWGEPAPLPGARMAVIQGDPSKEGLFVYRLKMPAGYKVPPHLHKASENVTVLSGVFFVGAGEKFDQGAGQELRWADSSRSRRITRTSPGQAVRKRSCRCTVWGRPISGS